MCCTVYAKQPLSTSLTFFSYQAAERGGSAPELRFGRPSSNLGAAIDRFFLVLTAQHGPPKSALLKTARVTRGSGGPQNYPSLVQARDGVNVSYDRVPWVGGCWTPSTLRVGPECVQRCEGPFECAMGPLRVCLEGPPELPFDGTHSCSTMRAPPTRTHSTPLVGYPRTTIPPGQYLYGQQCPTAGPRTIVDLDAIASFSYAKRAPDAIPFIAFLQAGESVPAMPWSLPPLAPISRGQVGGASPSAPRIGGVCDLHVDFAT